MPYTSERSTLLARATHGVAVSSDFVFVAAHTTIWFENVPPGTALASSAAFELKKNSTPSVASLERTAGAIDGHTVNPGCVCVPVLTRPVVSNCATLTVGEFDASAALENA